MLSPNDRAISGPENLGLNIIQLLSKFDHVLK